jgi:cytochrome c oxidase subunit 3
MSAVTVVAPHFEAADQQRAAASLGMWIFLTTETMFFGALFFAYAIARVSFPEAFAAASRHTNLVLGTTNTGVLLTSSLCMALASRAAMQGARRATVLLLVATAALGVAFAAIKLTEYGLDYREHLVPVLNFSFDARNARGAFVFFGLYFTTTGLHLLHLSIGVGLVLTIAWRVFHRRENALFDEVETIGLYWHFVDIVWIFLYPCLYLVSRS